MGQRALDGLLVRGLLGLARAIINGLSLLHRLHLLPAAVAAPALRLSSGLSRQSFRKLRRRRARESADRTRRNAR